MAKTGKGKNKARKHRKPEEPRRANPATKNDDDQEEYLAQESPPRRMARHQLGSEPESIAGKFTGREIRRPETDVLAD